MNARIRPSHSADEFGIDVLAGDNEMFQWFLLAYLIGKPIQSQVAVRTWKLFINRRLDTPWAITETPHRHLVNLLDEGNYTRYDEKTASGLHKCMHQLIDEYEGSLYLMLERSATEDEFAKRLQRLYGVGPKTSEIFMRETEEFFARRIE